MKRELIIIAPIAIMLIAFIGYGSNVVVEKYSWEPKLRNLKTNAKDYKCNIDRTVPFCVAVEYEGYLNGVFFHERYVALSLFGIGMKLIHYENRAK